MSCNGTVPRIAVVSARVLAYFADPLRPIFREGMAGLGSIVGGKVPLMAAQTGRPLSGERLFARVDRELLEETTLTRVGVLRPITTLFCPQRFLEYPRDKFVELGFDMEGIPDDQETVLVWNPTVYVFAARVRGELPKEPVEGRRVFEINLLKDGAKKKVKRRHRPIIKAWRKHHTHGRAIPPIIEIYDEEDPADEPVASASEIRDEVD
ncbi:MAG: hypothetical protein KDD66_01150 [Bdellovibrionales bacterium]|nr:hypothetical protein [Bdellovibrionales bacterium]